MRSKSAPCTRWAVPLLWWRIGSTGKSNATLTVTGSAVELPPVHPLPSLLCAAAAIASGGRERSGSAKVEAADARSSVENKMLASRKRKAARGAGELRKTARRNTCSACDEWRRATRADAQPLAMAASR
eukprot:scaffold105433_cov31-Tisochrysis_lutea.AAC.6